MMQNRVYLKRILITAAVLIFGYILANIFIFKSGVAITITTHEPTEIVINDLRGTEVDTKNINGTSEINLPENQIFVLTGSSESGSYLSVVDTNTDSKQLSAEFRPQQFPEDPILISPNDYWNYQYEDGVLLYESVYDNEVFVDPGKGKLLSYENIKDKNIFALLASDKKGFYYTKTSASESGVSASAFRKSLSGKTSTLCKTSSLIDDFGVYGTTLSVATDGGVMACNKSKSFVIPKTSYDEGSVVKLGASGVFTFFDAESHDDLRQSNREAGGQLVGSDGVVFSVDQSVDNVFWDEAGSQMAVIYDDLPAEVLSSKGELMSRLPVLTGELFAWSSKKEFLITYDSQLWLYDAEANSAIRVAKSNAGGFRSALYNNQLGSVIYSISGQGSALLNIDKNAAAFSYITPKLSKALADNFPKSNEKYSITYTLTQDKVVFEIKPFGILNYEWQLSQYQAEIKKNTETAKAFLKSLGFSTKNSIFKVEN